MDSEFDSDFQESWFKPGGKLTQWIDWRFQQLDQFRISDDVAKLEREGVCRETVGLCMFLLQIAPACDHYLKDHFGNKKARAKKARALISAAQTLREMQKLVPEMPPGVMKQAGLGETIKALEYWSSLLGWAEELYPVLGAKSLLEVGKFALAGVVKQVTGKFHDREVSALTGAALFNFDYDETAHRVWRIRAYPKLDKTLPIAVQIFSVMNNVLSGGTTVSPVTYEMPSDPA